MRPPPHGLTTPPKKNLKKPSPFPTCCLKSPHGRRWLRFLLISCLQNRWCGSVEGWGIFFLTARRSKNLIAEAYAPGWLSKKKFAIFWSPLPPGDLLARAHYDATGAPVLAPKKMRGVFQMVPHEVSTSVCLSALYGGPGARKKCPGASHSKNVREHRGRVGLFGVRNMVSERNAEKPSVVFLSIQLGLFALHGGPGAGKKCPGAQGSC